MEWLTLKGNKELKKNKKIVLVSGDEEYRSEEMLPQLAKILSSHHGFDCQVLFAQDPKYPGIIDPNHGTNIPGLEALEDADLMVLFTRFRALPGEQMEHIKNYLLTGKPLIGVRTATHAFHYKDTSHVWAHWGNYSKGEEDGWQGGFGKKVLGIPWVNHHGHHKHQSTRGVFAEGAENLSVTNGIKSGEIWGPTDVYGAPIPADAKPIVMGQVVNRAGEYDEKDLLYGMRDSDQEVATTNPANKNKINPNDPMMPIIWSKPYQLTGGKEGTAITSTIGASSDFLNAPLRRFFVNASYDLLGLTVPAEAKVDIVGKYEPSQFNFYSNEHWELTAMKVSECN